MKKVIFLLALFISLGFGAYYQGGNAMAAPLTQKENLPVTKKQAKEIALGKVKGEVVMIKLEEDDGRQYYEVIIKSSDSMYEVEIDAKTGQVLEVEQEGADDDDRDGDDAHDDELDD